MTNDTTALQERIAEELYYDQHPEGRHRSEWPTAVYPDDIYEYRDLAAAVLPIIAAEVRAAKAEALREAADGIDLDKIAEEWSQGPGNRDDMHWAAGNAASSVVLALYDRATEYKTGERA